MYVNKSHLFVTHKSAVLVSCPLLHDSGDVVQFAEWVGGARDAVH